MRYMRPVDLARVVIDGMAPMATAQDPVTWRRRLRLLMWDAAWLVEDLVERPIRVAITRRNEYGAAPKVWWAWVKFGAEEWPHGLHWTRHWWNTPDARSSAPEGPLPK